MNRSAAVVVGAVLLILIGALVWKSGGPSKPAIGPAASAAREGLTAPSSIEGGGGPEPLLNPKLDTDGGLVTAGEPLEPKAEQERDAGYPPGLAKTVRFGVILVQYRGAELAPPSARSKPEALALARTLAEAANTDFKAQVHRGDPGSIEDAGRIQRGVLEPAVESTLFMLPRGSVSEPIDTPRGFWIVRRID